MPTQDGVHHNIQSNENALQSAGPMNSTQNTLSQQSSASGPVLCSVRDYDPHWYVRENINPKEIEEFTSRMKFENLFSSKVLREGDTLVLDVQIVASGVSKKAHWTVRFSNVSIQA